MSGSQHALPAVRPATRGRSLLIAAACAVLGVGVVVSTLAGGTSTLEQQLQTAVPVVEDQQDGAAADDAPTDDAMVTAPVLLQGESIALGRDPFEPVVPEPEPVDAPSDGTPTDGGVSIDPDDDADGSVDPTDGSVQPVPAPGERACTGDEEVVCDGRVLTLLEVDADAEPPTARIRVGTEDFVVERGDEFAQAPVFRVLEIRADRVTLANGDEVFVLRLGTQRMK